ncbi:tripartite tricarboxylate transporter substrate-binding protein, partial [Acinetobacter baumannii]
LPSVQAGLIRPIAVTASRRIPELPNVPAMAEILPGYEMTSWTTMIGPAGIRGDVVERINALTVRALADAAVKKRYAELG